MDEASEAARPAGAPRKPSAAVRLAGGVIALAGIAAIFSPDAVADLLHRPAETSGEAINLRATRGGSLLGLGGLLAVGRLAPRPVLRAELLG